MQNFNLTSDGCGCDEDLFMKMSTANFWVFNLLRFKEKETVKPRRRFADKKSASIWKALDSEKKEVNIAAEIGNAAWWNDRSK